MECGHLVGNQLPILLIDFDDFVSQLLDRWESVTNPLDRLLIVRLVLDGLLGISYQSS